MKDIWIAVLGTLGVVVATFVGWLTTRRLSSGSAKTSDAAVLWEASETIRNDQRDEIVKLRAEVSELHKEVKELRRKVDEQSTIIGKLEARLERFMSSGRG